MNELIFQPYEWVVDDIDNTTMIRIWGHDINSNRVLIRIEDFKPFVRVELPLYIGGEEAEWDEFNIKIYIEYLNFVLKDDKPEDYKLEFKKKLYFYKKKYYPILTLWFANEKAKQHYVNLCYKEQTIKKLIDRPIQMTVLENSITTIHQLVTLKNIKYCGWLKCKYENVNKIDKLSNNLYEYTSNYESLECVNDDSIKTRIINPIMCCIDIEAYSNNKKKMPNKKLITDEITMISFIIQRCIPVKGEFGSEDGRKRILLVNLGMEDIPNAEVIKFDNEIEMLKNIGDIIKKYDPTIITGYNIYKFDIPYIDFRFKLYHEEWPHLSCMKNDKTEVIIKEWWSSAYGFVTITNLKAEGRLTIDLYPIIKRDYKLEKYTLEFVSQYFLNKGKHDVKASEMFKIFEDLKNATNESIKDYDRLKKIEQENRRVGEYCLEDSILPLDLFNKCNVLIGLIQMSNVLQVPLMYIFTRGEQIRIYNQLYSWCLKENIVIDSYKNPTKFNGGYVVPPIPGYYRNILIFDFASLYPSIIRAYNICFTTLVLDNDIPDEDCNIYIDESTSQKFRFIKEKFYQGILPRMCKHLVEERNNVRGKQKNVDDPILYKVLEITQLALKKAANSIFGSLGASNGYLPLPEGATFITGTGRKLNHICQNYVRENIDGGEIVYGDTDSIMVNLNIEDPHKCKQFGNTIASEITKLFPSPLSLEFERTLSVGFFIKKKMYAGIPMSFIDKKSKSNTVISCEKVEQFLEYTNNNEYLYKIEWINHKKNDEKKITYLLIPIYADLISYDHYAGLEVLEGGQPILNNILKKGITIARRDKCIWVRKAYLKVLIAILFQKYLDYVLDIVNSEISRCMSRGVDFKEFICTREVNDYKETSNAPIKLFKDLMLQTGTPFEKGERIDYVFKKCSNPEFIKQGYKMTLLETYWRNCYEEPLDTSFYIEKQFQNPIQQIINLAYGNIIQENMIKCQPFKKTKKIYTYVTDKYIDTWVRSIKYKENWIEQLKKNKV